MTPTTPTTPKCEHECHEVNEQDEHCSWCLPAPHTSPERKYRNKQWDFVEDGIEAERNRILTIIKKHKEDSRSDGSFKHDDCYDELTKEILK